MYLVCCYLCGEYVESKLFSDLYSAKLYKIGYDDYYHSSEIIFINDNEVIYE